MHVYSADEGERLVRAARHTIELTLKSPRFKKAIVADSVKDLTERDGIFVTIESYPTGALRGCIGFPRAIAPVGEAVVEAARATAFEDPRFVPISDKELDRLIIEVSVLTAPEEITGAASQRYKKIKVGKDGLIAKYGLYEGLLLPIVAVEQKWNEKRFLDESCMKAGIPQNSWMQQNVKMYRFQTQVFKEEKPDGKVSEIKMG